MPEDTEPNLEETISFACTAEFKEVIKRLAKADGRSPGQMARWLLEQAVAERTAAAS